MKGKLIVICGTDGSGKTTQTEILVERLKKEGYQVEKTDFPQYNEWSSIFVQKYLNGEFGSADEVGPYRASVFFAIDRYAASKKMYEWLKQGKIIVSNRYVSANQGHQGGKIRDPVEREKYLDWLDNLEFNIFKIPRPDVNFFLYVPAEIGQKLVDKKGHRDYVGGKKRDIHEADINHLKNAEEAYLYMTNKDPTWIKIDCAENSQILPIEVISEKIWKEVKKIISN
jgi:dTMP kinase